MQTETDQIKTKIIFPNNPTQWNDTDSDGWGDNVCLQRNGLIPMYRDNQSFNFTNNPTQWQDSDGGYRGRPINRSNTS